MSITISDTEPRVQYTASNGQTAFSVGFEFFNNSDLVVVKTSSSTDTTLTYSATPSSAAQYSVAGAGVSGGGSITLGGGATLNDKYTIYRNLPVARTTDFSASGSFPVETLNTELDKVIAMTQQVERDLKFSPRAAATTSTAYNLTFPELVANKILSVNSAGTAVEFDQTTTDVSTVAGLSTEIAALSAVDTEIGLLGTSAVITDLGILGTADVVTDLNVLGTADVVSDMNTLATSDIVSDMNTLATSANVTAMGLLGNSTSVTNMGLLGVSGVITDMNLLGTSAIVTDLDLLGTSANVTAMGLLGNSTTITNMGLLGTSTVVTDMGLLGTSDCVADMAILGTSDVVTDLNTLATSAIVTDLDLLATSANVTAMGLLGNSTTVTNMGLLGTSAVVTDMGLLGTSACVADMAILATSDIVADMAILATSDIVSDLNTLATSDIVSDLNTLATSDIVTDINLLATSDIVSDLNTLATSAIVTNLNTVATNIAGVNSFAERYRVASSDPSSSLDEGDLAYNSTSNTLKYYNGSAWITIVAGSLTDVVQDGTPQLGGALDVNGNAIVSASNADIAITPNGSGDVILDGLKYPQADGSANQFLQTDGSAQLAFATVDLTALSATNLTSGTVPDARFPSTLPATSGVNLTALNATNLGSGTVAEARLPSSALGAVWESKSANFTAAARKNYFCDTTSNAIDVTLPSGVIGDEIHFLDVSGTFDTNDLTILYGSSKIQGASSNLDVAVERAGFTLVYYNTTQGWLLKDV